MGNGYLINCSCKDKGDEWSFKSVVKAAHPLEAWQKFIQKWQDDFKNGEAEIDETTITKLSVEKICEGAEIII